MSYQIGEGHGCTAPFTVVFINQSPKGFGLNMLAIFVPEQGQPPVLGDGGLVVGFFFDLHYD